MRAKTSVYHQCPLMPILLILQSPEGLLNHKRKLKLVFEFFVDSESACGDSSIYCGMFTPLANQAGYIWILTQTT